MAGTVIFKRDEKGIGEILKSDDVRKELKRRAELCATQMQLSEPTIAEEIDIWSETTDRAVENVTVRHPKAIEQQVKTGYITHSVLIAQLDFKPRS